MFRCSVVEFEDDDWTWRRRRLRDGCICQVVLVVFALPSFAQS